MGSGKKKKKEDKSKPKKKTTSDSAKKKKKKQVDSDVESSDVKSSDASDVEDSRSRRRGGRWKRLTRSRVSTISQASSVSSVSTNNSTVETSDAHNRLTTIRTILFWLLAISALVAMAIFQVDYNGVGSDNVNSHEVLGMIAFSLTLCIVGMGLYGTYYIIPLYIFLCSILFLVLTIIKLAIASGSGLLLAQIFLHVPYVTVVFLGFAFACLAMVTDY